MRFPAALSLPLLIAAAVLTAPAARIETTQYVNNEREFKWVFTWDNTLPAAEEYWSPPTADGNEPWHTENASGDKSPVYMSFQTFGGDNVLNDLAFRAQHFKGPHLQDVDPGAEFFFTLDNIFAVPSPKAAKENRLHQHNPLAHADSYLVNYATGQPKSTFTFSGVHTPEPGTFGICGIAAIAGLVILRRR